VVYVYLFFDTWFAYYSLYGSSFLDEYQKVYTCSPEEPGALSLIILIIGVFSKSLIGKCEVNNFAKALSGISEMGFHELFFPYSRAEKEHRKHI
jgi:hypothetical protein